MISVPRIRLTQPLCFLALLFIIGGVEQAASAAGVPVLISEPVSTRAIALSSPTLLREPFSPICSTPLCEGQRTRVMLFAMNLTLQPGEELSVVSAEAEGEAHRVYSLKVEYVGKVPGYDWLNAVVVKLDDGLGDVGDVLVRIAYRGAGSNRVRVGIGHIGGGLADDDGALPTPGPPFVISGQIIAEGRPLSGITIGLSGSQTSSAFTDANGAYNFSVPAGGDYTITPSEKNYYTFAPQSRSFVNVLAAQTANFNATPAPITSPQHVLEFDGAPKTVDYGYYFEPDIDLGHFFWEFWAVPGEQAGGTYLLSDGYGGAHALLFGFGFFGGSEPGRYQLTGNIWTGSAATTFSSDEGPAVGEWGHLSIGWDGREIITYFNGVPVGKTAFAGPRRSGGFVNGGGRLLIGGSDHSNLIGKIAQVRGFENINPREVTSDAGAIHATFAPETVFRLGGNLLSNYFSVTQTVDDLSTGLNGSLHRGRLRGTPYPYGLLTFCEECPRPQYVIDPTAPDFSTATDPSQRQFTPPAAPGGALIYDSFTRQNSTYALEGKGGLGSTEGGSQGTQLWRTDTSSLSRQPFGILNTRAVSLANRTALAWVAISNAETNHEIRVDRHPGTWGSGLDTGLSFRVEDASNYFFAYTGESNQDAGVRALNVGYYHGGQRTELATGVLMPRGWTTLRVLTTAAGAFSIYADGTLVYSSTNRALSNGTGAGIYNDRPGLGLTNRWDNFTVY